MKNAFKKEENPANFHRFSELDALRGIAALMVVFFHFSTVRINPGKVFLWGRAGVDMFFVISGFVIFMSINKANNINQFAFSRFSRLFPAYWFSVTLTALIQIIALKLNFVHSTTTNITWLKYLTNLTMFQTYFGYSHIDQPYWTLLIEMLFYIGIALLLKFNKIKNIFNIGILILFIVFINDCLGHIFSTWPAKQIIFLFPILNYISLFFAGILFYKIVTEPKNKVRFYITILLCFLVQIKIYYTILSPLNVSKLPQYGLNFIQYTIVLALIFGVFILFVNKKLIFIINKPTLFFGKISFSLYLIHQYIGANIIMPGLERIMHLPIFISFLVALVVVIYIAYLINKYIEIPAGKFLKAKFQKKSLLITANA